MRVKKAHGSKGINNWEGKDACLFLFIKNMKEVCMIQVNAVLERLTTKEVLEYYGVHFNSRGFAHCPFHEDKTPSFYYYKKNIINKIIKLL